MPLLPLQRRQALAWLAASSLPLAARASSPDTVRINISLEPDSLDPTRSAAASNAQVSHLNIFEGLTKITQDGSTAPLLAERWSVSADQRTWRFTLRSGVRFHDGQLLDADVVRWCFTQAQQPDWGNKGRASLFANMAEIQAPAPDTVVLHLHQPDPHLLFRLGESFAVIVHPQTAAQAATQPVGTGPYRFERWQRGVAVHLQRHPRYWGTAGQIAQAAFYFHSQPQAQAQALARQDIDVFFNFVSAALDHYRTDARYQVLVGASGGKGLLTLNHRLPLFQDVRVRQALTHAIDREKFIQTALRGYGSVIGSHFAPGDPGYIRLAAQYPYDPERARHLLQAAGVQTPVRMTLALPPTPYAMEGGPLIAHDLAQVGFTVDLQRLTWQQWLAGPFRGDFTMTLINHVEPLDYAIYADPGYYFGYDSADFRTLLAQHRSATAVRQRQQLFTQIQRFLANEAANVWIFNASIGCVVRKGLQGVWSNYPIFAHDVAAMHWVS